ncbi:MAG: PilZ domain-containing protein [Candidatus Acidiferrales bacterium]
MSPAKTLTKSAKGPKPGKDQKKFWPPREEQRLPHLRNLSLVYEGYSEVVSLRPPDISLRGMFINTDRRFPEGAVLKLHFRLTRSGEEVVARSEVRYCIPGVGVGVEFIELPPKSARAIQRELGLAGVLRKRPAKSKTSSNGA